MLRQMRSGALSGFFLVFLLLGGVGLVMTDWGGFFSGGVSARNVAEVDGTEISFVSFDNQVRQFLSNRNISAEMAYQAGIIDQILAARISRILLEKSGKEMGLLIPDYLIAQRLRPVVDMLTSQGLTKQQALERLASQNGTSSEGLIENTRASYLQQILFDSLSMKEGYIPDIMAKRIYQYNNESRKVAVKYMGHEDIKDIKTPSKEELESYYMDIRSDYIIPEARVFQLAYIDRNALKKGISISDEELQQAYEDRKSNYTLPERRVLEQAVLQDKSVAEQVLKAAQNGLDLKKALKKATGDTKAYREPDSFEKQGLPDLLGNKVFKPDNAGALVGPVQSPLGFHVVKIREIKPGHLQPFDEIKQEIEQDLIAQQLEDTLLELAMDIDNNLAEGLGLTEMVKKYDMETLRIGPLTKNGKLLEKKEKDSQALPDNFNEDKEYLLENVFTTPAGDVSQVLEMENGSLAFVFVEDVNSQSYEPLEEIQSEVVERWREEQKERKNYDRAKRLLDDLENNSKESSEVNFKTLESVARQDEPTGPMQKQTIDAIFSTPVNEFFLAQAQGGFYVGQVKEVSLPVIDSIKSEDMEGILQELAGANEEALTQLMINKLRSQSDININRDLLEERYGLSGTQ